MECYTLLERIGFLRAAATYAFSSLNTRTQTAHGLSLQREHLVSSLYPQWDDKRNARYPHQAPYSRQLGVHLQPQVGDVVRDTARKVAEAQCVDGRRRNTCEVCGCKTRCIETEGLEAVLCGCFCSQEELLVLECVSKGGNLRRTWDKCNLQRCRDGSSFQCCFCENGDCICRMFLLRLRWWCRHEEEIWRGMQLGPVGSKLVGL